MRKLIPIAVFIAFMASYSVFFGDQFDPGAIRNKRVLVTGASSGIGEQVAYYYSQHGARLVITARREDLLKKVAKKCQKLGARQVDIVAADMASSVDRSRVIDVTRKRLAGLDHLILNHASLYHEWWLGRPEDLDSFELMLKVNCLSYVDLASKCVDMLTRSRGNIGVVSSGFGEFGAVKTTAYSASKFALHGFFSSFRQELNANKTGVSVTIMVLGPVASEKMLDMHEKSVSRLPTDYFPSTEYAARSIVKSVAQRRYKVRHNMMKYVLVISDLFPTFAENWFSGFLLEHEESANNWFLMSFIRITAYLSTID